MNKRTTFSMIVLALAALTMVTACARESKQNQPVTSTTNGRTTTAPPATEVEKRDRALVRVVNTIPGTPVDIFAEDNETFRNVGYNMVTPYQEVSAERLTFRVRPVGQESAEPIAENSETLGGGDHYTLVVLPETGTTREVARETKTGIKVDLRALSDNLTPPSSGKAKVRVINAAPDVGELDVYVRGRDEALFTGINFKSEAGYDEIDPVSGTVEVRPQGKKNVLATMSNVDFQAGKIYTMIITGRGKARLQAVKIEDQLQGQGQSSTATSTPSGGNEPTTDHKSTDNKHR